MPSPSTDRVAAPSSAAPPHPDEASWVFGDRRWRARGLSKALTPGALKVNLFVSRESGSFHVDTVELYSARQRAAYLKQASEELGVEERILKKDLGEVLLRLEERQEQQLKQEKAEKKAAELTEEDQRAALELLSDPKLLERLLRDFERCGVVGEETNKLVGYLAATSRKLDQPLAVIIQSSSAAGKSSLMDAVLSLMPEEERVEYSAMTGQSLFYMGEADLKHKILAIVEEGRRGAGLIRAEALAKRGGADDRIDGQGSSDGATGNARVPGGGAGDDLLDDDSDRSGRRVVETAA